MRVIMVLLSVSTLLAIACQPPQGRKKQNHHSNTTEELQTVAIPDKRRTLSLVGRWQLLDTGFPSEAFWRP